MAGILSPSPSLAPVRLIDIDAPAFLTMLAAQEALAAGRRVGARRLPRFIRARGMQAADRHLPDIDFTGSELDGSSFARTDLSRAVLFAASLRGCDLSQATLARADLRGARLGGAVLTGANLDGADMRGAVMVFADAIGALQVSHQDVNPDHGADFTNCSLKGANLRNANLRGARFDNANLDGADLTGARTEGARFRGAILTNAKLSTVALPREVLAQCVLDPRPSTPDDVLAIQIALAEAETWVGSRGAAGQPARLAGVDLRLAGPAYTSRGLSGGDFSATCGVAVDFSGSQLSGANFNGADLRSAKFQNADLRGASFRDANLAHASFLRADLAAIQMLSGKERRVDFSGAILHGTGLNVEWLS